MCTTLLERFGSGRENDAADDLAASHLTVRFAGLPERQDAVDRGEAMLRSLFPLPDGWQFPP